MSCRFAIAKRVCLRSYGRSHDQQAHVLEEAARGLRGHVVLCGFGRIGQYLARFLTEEGFLYVAVGRPLGGLGLQGCSWGRPRPWRMPRHCFTRGEAVA